MAPPRSNEPLQSSDDANARSPAPASRLREVAGLFTLLGFTAFGGPAAHIALMEDQVVRRRRWLDRTQFLHLVAAISFIPGPNSTELAIQLGLTRAGFRGMIVAGACFILPAVSIILPLAWLYVHWGQTPRVLDALTGINACVVAIVAAALCRFAQTGIKDRFTAAVALLCAAAYAISHTLAASQPEIILLAFAGILGAFWYGRHEAKPLVALLSPGVFHLGLPAAALATVTTLALEAGLLAMSLFFLKIGVTLFGSGYVLVSYLRTGLVEQHHWLTQRQLLDAIAVGQVTPGPLLTTAAFIGYFLGDRVFAGGVAGGVAGGLLATLAIFLPSFVFVALLGRILPRMQRSPLVRGALDTMNAAVVALILVVTVRLGLAALHGFMTWAIALVTLAAILVGKVNATWLLLGAALVGWIIHPG